jgi:phosphatidylinositol alpha-1,6-mannosyltransferase
MHLLFVTQDFPPAVGGIETYAAELAPRLAARCERFLLIAPTRPNCESVDASLDYPIYRLPIRPDLLVFRAIPHLISRTQTERFDTALHLQWPTVYASLLAQRFSGSPNRIALTVNGKDTVFNPFNVSLLRRLYDYLRNLSVTGADDVVTYSQFLADQAQSLGATRDQVSIIPFGTNPKVFYPESTSDLRTSIGAEGRPIVLSASRLVPKKGFDTALRAIRQVTEEVPDVLLLIAGDGPQGPALKQLMRDLDLQDHVRFLGNLPHDQLRSYYSLADVFLMAGHREPDDVEGFGLVYLEANACGTPTIGSRVGGVPDAVWHEQTGLLVPPRDPAATAEALTRLLTNPELADRLGKQGRQRVLDEANWDRIADDVFDLLASST